MGWDEGARAALGSVGWLICLWLKPLSAGGRQEALRLRQASPRPALKRAGDRDPEISQRMRPTPQSSG